MKCNEIRELLSLYIDDMLDESEKREVEEHLSACGDCRKEYNEIKEVLDLLGQTEIIPVPESFNFRLNKALKEEKQNMIAAGILGKPSKKNRWRVITSVAAVFAVGVVSFGLYYDIFGVLPDQLNGEAQTGTAREESAPSEIAEMDLYGDDSGGTEESATGLKPMSKAADRADSAGNAEDSDRNSSIQYDMAGGGSEPYTGDQEPYTGDPEPMKTKTRQSAEGSAVPKESPAAAPETVSAPDATQEPAAAEKASDGAGASGQDGAGAGQDGAGASDQSTDNIDNITPFWYETSRSLTSSGVERETASEKYYSNLLEEKLKDFDYQILSSEYTKDGEWLFRVFIFFGKDGNTYNEEITIIGKDGKIEAIDSNHSNELMGL